MILEDLFHAALARSPSEREAFLTDACSGDEKLRQRLESLLHAHENPGSFLAGNPAQPMGNLEASMRRPTLDVSAEDGVGSVIGPYKLVEPIGEGGMGTVWMAQQTEPVKRLVAVKLIKSGRDSKQVIARFEAERQALALMDHPNIAKVFDAGTTSPSVVERSVVEQSPEVAERSPDRSTAGLWHGRPYFVMELVKGVPITKYCDEHRLTPRQRLELFIPVCQAVQHAHQKGIIHRDLKPSNVLVALYDGKPVPKVIDFGVAKSAGQPLTEQALVTSFGTIVGTLEYMSPEQAELNQLDIDTRSDIYSLGVLLYELLTGTTPLDRKQHKDTPLFELLRIVREQDAPTLSIRLSSTVELPAIAAYRGTEPAKLTKLVRGELDWIVMKALEKDRSRRYETANSFAMDVQRYLADEPLSACPPSAAYRLRKFFRRNRGPVLAATVSLFLLVGGIIGSTLGLIRALAAERLALQRLERAEYAEAAANDERNKALDARKAAIDSEEDTRAFSKFLVNHVLATARPEGVQNGLGYDVTVARALEAAETQLADVFANRPRAEATARDAIGKTWRNLGEYARAEAHLGRALQLRNRELASDDPETLDTANSLAVCLSRMGHMEMAIRIHEQTLAGKKARLGPTHVQTLTTMHNLATAYRNAWELDRAVSLHEETLQLTRAQLGPEHPSTLTSMNGLASTYQAAGRLEESLPLFEESLKLRRSQLGSDHPDTINSMDGLASAYQAAGRLYEALPLFEQSLKLRKVRLGPKHPDTLDSMNNLAVGYWAARRLDEALALFQETLNLRRTQLGPAHPDTLLSMHNLASTYHEAGKLRDARTLYEETLKLRKPKLGLEHPDTICTMSKLGSAYRDAGKLDLALPLLETTLKLRKARLGQEHPDTLASMNDLSVTYQEAGKLDLALPLCEQTLALTKAKLGAEHPETLRSRNNLGTAYLDAGKLDQALPHLEEALKLKKARLGADHPDTVRCMNNLAAAYLEAFKPDQALLLFEETLKLMEAKLGPKHPHTIACMNNLGMAYRNAGKLDQCVPLLEETLKLYKAILGPDHPSTLRSMHNLATVYGDVGKPDQGLPLLEEALKLRKVKLGPEHPETLANMHNLACSYRDAGKLDQALPLFEETLKLRKANLGPQDPNTAQTMESLGLARLRAQKPAEAESLLRECLAIRQKQRPDDWPTFHVTSLLGGSLLGQTKYAEAEPLLLRGYLGMKEREAKIPAQSKVRLTEALESLVKLYDAWAMPEKAAEWRRVLEEQKERSVSKKPKGAQAK